jgi:hypothetical protein
MNWINFFFNFLYRIILLLLKGDEGYREFLFLKCHFTLIVTHFIEFVAMDLYFKLNYLFYEFFVLNNLFKCDF